MNQKKPEWLKVKLQGEKEIHEVRTMLERFSLHTVCEEARCPNIIECFGRKTATFMILGNICTRNCTFCNITPGRPLSPDPDEPFHVAQAVRGLELKHAVITSVTRDDLADGGASHFARVIEEIKKLDMQIQIEVLVPDFKGDQEALLQVVLAKPQIINHNVETVPRLYPSVRPEADYPRSLQLLKRVKNRDRDLFTKSGLMLGLGEERDEVLSVFDDLRNVECDFLTVGQYLAPSNQHHPVIGFVHPDIFEEYRIEGLKRGFKHVASAPLVRSSYHAEQAIQRLMF
ncbi:MAG: lipoyl synthase [Deltaproteobacteria bacterium RBG_13_49_15]|nr:MAG: lipoyl synthase [Deltaproteobacteria bacterium RBG_13_49_15]